MDLRKKWILFCFFPLLSSAFFIATQSKTCLYQHKYNMCLWFTMNRTWDRGLATFSQAAAWLSAASFRGGSSKPTKLYLTLTALPRPMLARTLAHQRQALCLRQENISAATYTLLRVRLEEASSSTSSPLGAYLTLCKTAASVCWLSVVVDDNWCGAEATWICGSAHIQMGRWEG